MRRVVFQPWTRVSAGQGASGWSVALGHRWLTIPGELVLVQTHDLFWLHPAVPGDRGTALDLGLVLVSQANAPPAARAGRRAGSSPACARPRPVSGPAARRSPAAPHPTTSGCAPVLPAKAIAGAAPPLRRAPVQRAEGKKRACAPAQRECAAQPARPADSDGREAQTVSGWCGFKPKLGATTRMDCPLAILSRVLSVCRDYGWGA